MKVKIKTAHGYLSFQPNGTVQYREHAGPWEEIDLEGLAPIYATLFPPMDNTPKPSPIGPAPSASAAYVANVKSQCIAAGIDLSGPCGAFEITKRVAWGLRATGAGLLSKQGGNNCQGFATDIVCWPDRAVDILSDGGNNNGPIWSETGVDDLASRWRPAVQP